VDHANLAEDENALTALDVDADALRHAERDILIAFCEKSTPCAYMLPTSWLI